jgi:hypothetical protein
MFDGVAVSVCFVAEVHPEFEQAGMQPGRAIDEEFGVIDCVFVLQLSQKQFHYRGVSGGLQVYVCDTVVAGSTAATSQNRSPSTLTIVSSSAI